MTKPSQITSESFRAYIRFSDGKPDIIWPGLSFTKAHWRYHWIKRQFFAGHYKNVNIYGFQSESFNR